MQIDYEKMCDCYNRINKILVDIEENSQSIKETVAQLKTNELWQGKSYDMFKNKADRIITNLNSYLSQVKQLNNVIQTSVEKYKAVDKQVMSALEGINT